MEYKENWEKLEGNWKESKWNLKGNQVESCLFRIGKHLSYTMPVDATESIKNVKITIFAKETH